MRWEGGFRRGMLDVLVIYVMNRTRGFISSTRLRSSASREKIFTCSTHVHRSQLSSAMKSPSSILRFERTSKLLWVPTCR